LSLSVNKNNSGTIKKPLGLTKWDNNKRKKRHKFTGIEKLINNLGIVEIVIRMLNALGRRVSESSVREKCMHGLIRRRRAIVLRLTSLCSFEILITLYIYI